MRVRLARYNFPDNPEWIIMSETIPLGTEYEVVGYRAENEGFTITNLYTKEQKPVACYLLKGNGDTGWLPTCCFEPIEEIIGELESNGKD